MGFRFRKSINVGGGFRINFSKSGIGYSWGMKGFRITKTAKGAIRTTLSIPKTGISYSTEIRPNRSKQTHIQSIHTNKTLDEGFVGDNTETKIDWKKYDDIEKSDNKETIANCDNVNTEDNRGYLSVWLIPIIKILIAGVFLICVPCFINQCSTYMKEQNEQQNEQYKNVKAYFDYVVEFEPDDYQKQFNLFQLMNGIKGERFVRRVNGDLFEKYNSQIDEDYEIIDLNKQISEFNRLYGKLSGKDVQLCNLNSSEAEVCDIQYLNYLIHELSPLCYDFKSANLVDNIKLSVLAKNEDWNRIVELAEFWIAKKYTLTDETMFYYFYALVHVEQYDRSFKVLNNKMAGWQTLQRSSDNDSIWIQNDGAVETIARVIDQYEKAQIDKVRACSEVVSLTSILHSYYDNRSIAFSTYCNCLFKLSESNIEHENIEQARANLDKARDYKCDSKNYIKLINKVNQMKKAIATRLEQQKKEEQRVERERRKLEKQTYEKELRKQKKCENRKRQLTGRCCCLDGTIGSCGRGGCSHHGGITGWHFCLKGYCD